MGELVMTNSDEPATPKHLTPYDPTSLERALIAKLRDKFGFEIQELNHLSVKAYNAHYRFKDQRDDQDYHLVVYTLPEDLPLKGIYFEHAILRHLAASGFEKIPKLFVHNNESLFNIDHIFFCITEWIEDCIPIPNYDLTSAMITYMGTAIGDLLEKLSTLDLILDYYPEHLFVYPASAFRKVFHDLIDGLEKRVFVSSRELFDYQARVNVNTFVPIARQFMKDFDWELYNAVRAEDQTKIVHGDYRPMNIVFDQQSGEVSKILDFNCSFNEIRLWDICYTALSLEGKETIGCAESFERATAFIHAFHNSHPLTAKEQQLLPSFLPFVIVKLMTAATESWWINDRLEMLERLLQESQPLVQTALAE